MSTGYKISEKEGLYFLTLKIVSWVDLFTRKEHRDIVIEALQFCQQEKGLNIFAFVIMSNHIHLLAQSENGNLSGTIRDFKSFTTKKFFEVIKSGRESRADWLEMIFKYHAKFKESQYNQIWTNDNHAELIYSEKFIRQKLDYIHSNPVKAGIVERPEDYLYSSARNYAELDSVIDVHILTLRWRTV